MTLFEGPIRTYLHREAEILSTIEATLEQKRRIVLEWLNSKLPSNFKNDSLAMRDSISKAFRLL